jgi:hypothetical protein
MQRPSGIGAFEFVILSSLRAAQLMRGCVPRVDGGHKMTVTAQLEVARGMVMQDDSPIVKPEDTPEVVLVSAAEPPLAAVEGI